MKPKLIQSILAASLALSLPTLSSAQLADEEGWQVLDEVLQIINDEIITASELTREANEIRSSQNITISTLEELQKFQSEVRTRIVILRLQAEAGRELGLPEEQVEQIVTSHIDGMRRRSGLQSYIENLDERGMAADEFQLDTKRQFYGQTWMDDIVGDNKSGKRPYRDRFVRPGEMHQIYTDVREQFGAPEKVELEQFITAPAHDADPVAALAEATNLRQRAIAGADLASLVREIGPKRSVTTSFAVPIRNLTPDPALKAFAETAQIGDFSEVQSDMDEEANELRYSFFRLEQRIAPVAPRPFMDGQVQAVLTNRALAQRDDWYLALGHQDLVEGSYIEPPLDLGAQAR